MRRHLNFISAQSLECYTLTQVSLFDDSSVRLSGDKLDDNHGGANIWRDAAQMIRVDQRESTPHTRNVTPEIVVRMKHYMITSEFRQLVVRF